MVDIFVGKEKISKSPLRILEWTFFYKIQDNFAAKCEKFKISKFLKFKLNFLTFKISQKPQFY